MGENKEYSFQIMPKTKTYYNNDSNFGIYAFTTNDDIPNCEIIKDDITGGKLKKSSLVGTMPKLTIGFPYDVVADLEYNKQYDKYQFKVKKILSAEMDSSESQKRFLMCITTQTRANALLKVYPNIVKMMINNDDKNIDLSQVKGIGLATYNTIKKQVIDHYEIRDIMSILSNVNVSMRRIEKMIDEFESPAILKQNLITNPYILTKVHGLGFKTVDDIALKLNPQMMNSKFRMEAYVTYFFKDEVAQAGHTWCTLEEIQKGATKIVPECIEHLESVLNNSMLIYTTEDGKIGLKEYYNVERKIFNLLVNFANSPKKQIYDVDIVNKIIEKIENEEGFKYTEEQKEVIFGVLNNNVSLISGEAGCVDCDTEFFNGTQWKKISEYQEGDMVLQYNLDGTANLVKPLEYHKYSSEYLTLVKTESGHVNQCLSDEHNVVYVTSKGNIAKKQFKEIRNMHNNCELGFGGRFINTFDFVQDNKINLSENEIRLMVAVIADGHFRNKTKQCRMNLKKQRKKDRLESLLDKCGIDYNKSKYNPKDLEFDCYTFTAPLRAKIFDSYWYNCNLEQRQIILDEIFFWDGSIDNKGRKNFSTAIKETADFVQFLCTSMGFRSTITTCDRVGTSYKDNDKYIRKSLEYSVHCNKRNNTSSIRARRKSNKTKFEQYKTKDGYKYCFSVPSEMLVLRREDRIFVTGNSGKSTVLKTILTVLEQYGNTIMCCAASAKASQRIIEATGYKASTIHMALGAKGLDNFDKNEDNPIEADVICLDEGSMVNAQLFLKLSLAIEKGSKIILVGDDGQLVAIGYGNVFSDLLSMDEIFSVGKLTQVQRQGSESAVLEHAREIRHRKNPLKERGIVLKTDKRDGLTEQEYYNKWFDFGVNKDLFYKLYKIDGESDKIKLRDDAIKSFMQLIKNEGGDKQAIEETIILTPRRQKVINSVDEINKLIVEEMVKNKYINPRLGKIIHNFTTYYVGCKVMQIENNYEKKIFNGSTGFITKIEKERVDGEETTLVYVEFKDFETNEYKEVVYTYGELEQISLAYALSVFKSQGSGFKNIIGIVTYESYSLLNNSMLYTLMTRFGKGKCIMHIEPTAFSKAIKTDAAKRNTFLKFMG